MNNYLILRSENSPYNDVTKSSVLSFADMDNNLLFLKGHVIYTAITNGSNVTLKKYNGEDITFAGGGSGTFTGGTITGPTNFTAGLTATTISATTLTLNGVTITGITNGTPFFLQNSPTTDAGSDKDAVIQRRGSIFVGDWNPSAGTGSFSFMGKNQFAIVHTGYTYINQESYQNSPNDSGSLGFYRQRGTPQASLNLLKNDVLGTIKFTTTAYGVSGGTQWDNFIGVYANENHGGGTYGVSGGTRMDFYLTPNGATGTRKALSIIGSGDTQIFGNLTASTVSATTYYNLPTATFSGGTVINPTNFTGGLSANTFSATTYLNLPKDIFTTGGTYSNGTTTFTNNTGGTFNVTGYFKTSDDIYTTGMTFNASNYNLTISRNDNTSFTQSLSILASDMTITGGTYNPNSGTATFTNNTGGTFNVTGFLTGQTDTYVTGLTFNNNVLTLKQTNNQSNISLLLNNLSGLTVNGSISATTISATTYYGLPSGPISVVNTSSLFSTGLPNTGYQASGVTHSIFMGQEAGFQAFNTSYSNLLGYQAGYGATGSTNVNFIGNNAGNGATNASSSIFIGSSAGISATNAYGSVFIGAGAGTSAFYSNDSNFLGQSAGKSATNANNSNFLGQSAGSGATNASYSNLFGYLAGKTFASNNIGSNNIIIGTNISLPNATTNSINIGGVLFGTDTYSSITGSPSISANTSGKIGIGIVTPTEKLHVSGNLKIDGNLTYTGQSNNPVYTAGTVTATHIPNWNNSNIQHVILSAATTSISGGTNIANGAVYTMILKQNASGSRVVIWDTQYKWQSGIAPVLSSTANAVDILTLISDGTNLYGLIAKDFR